MLVFAGLLALRVDEMNICLNVKPSQVPEFILQDLIQTIGKG